MAGCREFEWAANQTNMKCSACGGELPDNAMFCPTCATSVAMGSMTVTAPNVGPPAVPRAPAEPPNKKTPASSSSPSSARRGPQDHYIARSTLADRYRIVALLGKGGMGEVYRAEDLTLTQTVALKFLPVAMTQDESARARFHQEARLAREISHPTICRVFDI